jgi:hypothetical protein
MNITFRSTTRVEPMSKLLNWSLHNKKCQSMVDDIFCSKKIVKKLTYGDFIK